MIVVDKINRKITVNGNPVVLTNQQWDILVVFDKGEPVSVGKIAQRVYGSQIEKHKTTASVTVSRIKKLVGSNEFIVKYRGAGQYVFHPDVEVIEEVTE